MCSCDCDGVLESLIVTKEAPDTLEPRPIIIMVVAPPPCRLLVQRLVRALASELPPVPYDDVSDSLWLPLLRWYCCWCCCCVW